MPILACVPIMTSTLTHICFKITALNEFNAVGTISVSYARKIKLWRTNDHKFATACNLYAFR